MSLTGPGDDPASDRAATLPEVLFADEPAEGRGGGRWRPVVPTMARLPYSRELEQLPTTYLAARHSDPWKLRDRLLALACGPARMVGTGGTMALAQLAAQLHEHTSGQAARAMTPLGLLQAPDLHRAGAMLFSARARHPDALMVLERFGQGAYSPAVLVTHRDRGDLREHLHGDVSVVTVPAPGLPEGFLATNSVMAMTVALLRAALSDDALSPEPPFDSAGLDDVLPRERLLVLFAPALCSVATDIETRCHELGLAAVQLADLRNVAHGRHTGLARLASETTVLVLSDADSGPLAQAVSATLAVSDIEVVRWHVDLPWPDAVVALLAASMRMIGRLGAAHGVDPARPQVPEFGRRLYHLPLRRLLARAPASPVDLKHAALGAGAAANDTLWDRYTAAFSSWCEQLAQVALGAVVLDYDGTVCETTQRFDPPAEPVRTTLLRLLDGGLRLGFASGRGKSLHEGLRSWVPQSHWAAVTVGLYNGAVCMALADDLADISEPTGLMTEVTTRLQGLAFGELLELTSRSGQVTVHAAPGSFFHTGRLAVLVGEAVARVPTLPVKVVASAHSIDVIADDTSKVRVLDHVALHAAGEPLAVGDQGDIGGNDFELLAARTWSVSVGRCSADPSRCWPVDPVGRRGPAALLGVLDAIVLKDGLGILDVTRISNRRRHA